MKIFKTTLTTLLIAVSLFVLSSAMWRIYDARVNKNPFPTVMGTGFALVTSGSMEPTIHVNDLIIAKKVITENELRIGDIIIYRSHYVDEPVIHRIIEMDGDKIVTQGDANAIPDQAIDISQVLAVYKYRLPFIGPFINAIRAPLGMFVLAVMLIVFGAIDIIIVNKKENERLEELKREEKWKIIAKKAVTAETEGSNYDDYDDYDEDEFEY